MSTYVALLRAVNVGGTGKLPMAVLKTMCESIGFASVRTYIASGNVVFESRTRESTVKKALESALETYAGKQVAVMVRSALEMSDVHRRNPFPHAAPNRVLAIFFDEPPSADALVGITHQQAEEIALGVREIYVHYGDRMAESKLKIPAARAGTSRNMRTVAALASMAETSGASRASPRS